MVPSSLTVILELLRCWGSLSSELICWGNSLFAPGRLCYNLQWSEEVDSWLCLLVESSLRVSRAGSELGSYSSPKTANRESSEMGLINSCHLAEIIYSRPIGSGCQSQRRRTDQLTKLFLNLQISKVKPKAVPCESLFDKLPISSQLWANNCWN